MSTEQDMSLTAAQTFETALPRSLVLDYHLTSIGRSGIIHADCFEWLSRLPECSLHAIVTDPPCGLTGYDLDRIEKRAAANGGVWRIPPSFDGRDRVLLPRPTAFSQKELKQIEHFFVVWARMVVHALRPGGHVFIASDVFFSQRVFSALVAGGLEFRGEVIRLVHTQRGGDCSPNAEEEFPEVSSLPRRCYEPWGILRKPLPSKMTVSDCLREFQTGGLRRTPDDKPFNDVIRSGPTSQQEKQIAPHRSLKPQAFLRQIVHTALPLGVGIIIDPFAGSGSTIAAAEAVGLSAVGAEKYLDYYEMSVGAIPRLAALKVPASEAEED
jgi:site-specific DNA-methyltransferase (adenine-specific)